jgi:hypothetical protein
MKAHVCLSKWVLVDNIMWVASKAIMGVVLVGDQATAQRN